MSLKFFEISEANHTIMNPLSEDKLLRLGSHLNLQPGMTQLDLACGQGEMLCRWAGAHGIRGTGVDLSHVFVRSAQARAAELGVAERVQFVQGDAADYARQSPDRFDLVSCIGATWIGGGTLGTLDLMKPRLMDPASGLLLIGEVYWLQDPPDAACAALDLPRESLTDLPGMLDRFDAAGVELVTMSLARRDEFDWYTAQRMMTGFRWLRANPDHEDAAEFRVWHEDITRTYLRYERPYVGWGIFVLAMK